MKSNLQGVFLLSGGNMAVSIFSFVRNIIIARLISVEDFGIAATFAMTIMFVELTGRQPCRRPAANSGAGQL